PCRWVLKKFLHRGFSFVRARQFLQADRAIDPRFRCPGSLRNKLQGFFQGFERSTVIRVLILELAVGERRLGTVTGGLGGRNIFLLCFNGRGIVERESRQDLLRQSVLGVITSDAL